MQVMILVWKIKKVKIGKHGTLSEITSSLEDLQQFSSITL